MLSYGPDDGSVYRAAIAAGADHFVRRRGRSDEQAANEIAAAGIHVPVDLGAHHRQPTWHIGAAPGAGAGPLPRLSRNHGCDYIDYFITDRVATPPRCAAEFTEQLAYVADCFMVSNGLDAERYARHATRADQGLPEDAFVFLQFRRIRRALHTACSRCGWKYCARSHRRSLDQAVPCADGRKSAQRGPAMRDRSEPACLRATGAGKAGAHRARRARRSGARHHRLVQRPQQHQRHAVGGRAGADGAGRDFCKPGGGKPAARCAMPEMVVHDARDYVEAATRLGTDRAQCAALKRKLADHRGSAPFFDARRTVASLERLYQEMWRASRSGEAPHTIS